MVSRTRVFSESSMILPTTISDTKPPSPGTGQFRRRVSAGSSSSSTNLYHPEPIVEYNNHHSINMNNSGHSSSPRPSSPRSPNRPCPKKGGASGWSTWLLILAMCSMGGFLIVGKQQLYGAHESLAQVQLERDVLTKNQGQLLLQLEQTRRKLGQTNTEGDVDGLQQRLRELENQLAAEMQIKQDTVYERDQLHEHVQAIARRSIIEKFGEGPHYVQFVLKLPNQNKREYFTVEMANIDHMPAAVYTFMMQVSKLLWDYTSFYLNADHVLMARPVSTNGKHSKRAQFDNEGLSHVPFQEYHEAYPHVEYTIGFSGRPAGPDIYINKEDNTIPHGPDGHQHFGSAEPCFGRIIIGKDVIDRISALPGLEEKPALLEKSVEILSVRVLDDLKDAVGGPQFIKQQTKMTN